MSCVPIPNIKPRYTSFGVCAFKYNLDDARSPDSNIRIKIKGVTDIL